MGEKLPRLRLKTHPATAIFSQHLRITRNCRSFVPFLPSLCRRSVPGNPRAVHCLTPRTPCRERRNEMRKEERERERERRGIIVMSNRKLTLNRGPSTVPPSMVSDPCGAAKKNTLAPEHPFTQPSDHPCRIAQLLKFPRDYRRALSMASSGPLHFIPDDSTREIVSKSYLL